MTQLWKVSRSNARWVAQWRRRVVQDMPFLLGEVHRRMVERARIMRPVEGGLLHQGWLHPDTLNPLRDLFPERDCTVLAPQPIDLPTHPAVQKNQSLFRALWAQWGQKAERALVAEPGQALPVGDGVAGMVWSPLWLHHVEDPAFQFQQWHRVLRPDGALFFSTFGPDTGLELRQALARLGVDMPDFVDMHDQGDLLAKSGFSDPVMEMEKLTLTYSTPDKLLDDWRALVVNNMSSGGSAWRGRTFPTRLKAELEALRQPATGRIHLTLELVYGHAWRVQRVPKTHVATVKLSDIGGRKPGSAT